MKKFCLLKLIGAMLFLSLTACTKENALMNTSEKSDMQNTDQAMLDFKDETELEQTLKNLALFSWEEKVAWAKRNNFYSFGVACDDFYRSIDFGKFANQHDLLKFVKDNSQYIQIIERENEPYIETRWHDNLERYLINKDHLYKVGTNVYKLLDEACVYSDISNIQVLRKIRTIADLSGLEDVVKLKYTDIASQSKTLPPMSNSQVFDEITERVTEDRNRTYASIRIRRQAIDEVSTNFRSLNYYVEHVIRPYKKTLGVWYWCTRTIYVDLKFLVSLNDTYYFRIVGSRKTSVIEGRIPYGKTYNMSIPDPKFEAFSISAKAGTEKYVNASRNGSRFDNANFNETVTIK